MNINVDNENFIKSIKSMKINTFEKSTYIIFYDKLHKEYKKYLEDNNIPKNNLKIITKDPKSIPKKFKHQVEVELNHEKELSIQMVISHVFNEKYDRVKVLEELNKFDNRHVLLWLESTASIYPSLAKRMSIIEKYVYSKYFKKIIVESLVGLKCIPYYRKEK